jgi:hypothetical protein
MFQQAIKQEAKLRLAIAGPAGSGKTYTGLSIAVPLAQGGKIAVVDTEHGSASKYADLFKFDVMEMFPPFHPDRFIEAIKEAQNAGYAVIVLDSLSHEWSGTGGILEVIDNFAAQSNSKNTFAAWKKGTPLQNKLIDTIIGCNIHVIATLRTKQDYVIEPDERGKMTPKKIGLAPVQRDGFEYEFDVVMNMDNDNQGLIVKTRCPDLMGGVFKKPGKDIAEILIGWLSGAPRVKAEPMPRQQEPIKVTTSNSSLISPQILIEEGLAENIPNASQILNLLGLAGKPAETGLVKARIYRAWRDTGLDTKDAAAKTIAGEYPPNT